MRVLFWGTPDFAVPSLAAVLESRHELVGLVTQPDRPRGRSGRAEAPATKSLLLRRGSTAPIHQPARPRGAEFRRAIRALAPDVSVVAAYGNILPESILALPRLGSLNVHASLLPRYRGASPVAAAILAGDDVTGITLMRMDAGLDTGAALIQRELPILPGETTGALTRRLADLGAEVLRVGLEAAAAGGLVEHPQDESLATYAPRITAAQARVDWSRPAAELERVLRAYDPWPGAATTWDGRRLKLFRGRAAPGDARLPGEIVAAPPGTLRIGTGEGLLEVGEVQLEGRPRMAASEFLRGRPLSSGTRLA